jgi:hypothetical protein
VIGRPILIGGQPIKAPPKPAPARTSALVKCQVVWQRIKLLPSRGDPICIGTLERAEDAVTGLERASWWYRRVLGNLACEFRAQDLAKAVSRVFACDKRTDSRMGMEAVPGIYLALGGSMEADSVWWVCEDR